MARLVEGVSRNLGEKRLTGLVLLDVAKAFDIIWVDGFVYKLIALNVTSYLVKTILFYLRGRTFEASVRAATTSRRGMRAGVAQGGIFSPVLISLYVNDMPIHFQHVELSLYAYDTAVIVTSRKSALLVSYLESYLSDLEHCLRESRIAINVSKSTAMLFTPRCIQFYCSGNQSCGLIQIAIWV